jgi:hypothetical protein
MISRAGAEAAAFYLSARTILILLLNSRRTMNGLYVAAMAAAAAAAVATGGRDLMRRNEAALKNTIIEETRAEINRRMQKLEVTERLLPLLQQYDGELALREHAVQRAAIQCREASVSASATARAAVDHAEEARAALDERARAHWADIERGFRNMYTYYDKEIAEAIKGLARRRVHSGSDSEESALSSDEH